MEHLCETVAATEGREFAAFISGVNGSSSVALPELWNDRDEVIADGDRPDLLGAF
jgi:hypothetical protein